MYTLEELSDVANALDPICRANGAEDGILEALLRSMYQEEAEELLDYVARVYAATSIDEILKEIR